jgi:hypothetical protein
MNASRTIQFLLVLLGAMATGGATAGRSQDAPAGAEPISQAQDERAATPDPARPVAEKCTGPAAARAQQKEPASKRVPPRRRSVQQVIGSVPPVATQTYGPTLTPPASTLRAPSSVAPAPVAGLPAVTPPPPAQLNSCVGNLCTDAAGSSYTGGIGNATVNSQGRLCNRVGNTVQCF